MSDAPNIRLDMCSNPLYLSGAREMVGAVARRLCFSDEACGQISLALDEALCNIIRHGYERRADGPIRISIYPIGGAAVPTLPASGAGADRAGAAGRSDPGCVCGGPTTALKIVIEDEARQVDPGAIRSRDLDQVRPGGLGVHIIRSVMDEVRYERREDCGGVGMRLTMIKKRTPVDGQHPPAEASCMGAGGQSQGAGAERGET